MQLGTIKKLIRIENATRRSASRHHEGYGIIRGRDGRDVYFLNSAVKGCRFDELASGQVVRFTVEVGPLRRAETVETIDSVKEDEMNV